jgi:hypothetical protein
VSRLHLALAKLCGLILFSCGNASAGIRPSFYLESCTWNATDIVIVTPSGTLTQFKVVEIIKGDLHAGRVLELPGLASSKGGSKRLAELDGDYQSHPFEPGHEFEDAPPARQGDRLIVFLRRPGALPEYNPRPDLPVDADGWQPAQLWGGFLTSAVWIQGGKLYAYSQTMNPGPTHLVGYKDREEVVRSQIAAVLKLRAAMDRAAATSDAVERSRQLVTLVRSGNVLGGIFARLSGLSKLAAGGGAEANALLALLSDESLLGWHQDIIRALVGKPMADSRFGGFLNQETEYWSKVCNSLKSGWWNDIGDPANELWRDHYTRAYALLDAIRARKLSEPTPEIRRFAVVWSQCPALEGRGEKDQMAEELNLLLAAAVH